MSDLNWNVKAILIAILLPMSSRSSDRPRLTRKGEATRARIVDAAAALIFQQGVAGTTVEEVRDGAHVSSSQLYHYFEDKPALVRAVIERQADRAIGTQEQFDLSSLDGLREWRDFCGRSRPRHGRALAVVRSARSVPRSPRPSPKPGQSLRRPSNGGRPASWPVFCGCTRLADSDPEADPRQLALALLAALEGGLLLAQIQRDPEPLAAALDTMLAHIATLSSTTSTSLNS